MLQYNVLIDHQLFHVKVTHPSFSSNHRCRGDQKSLSQSQGTHPNLTAESHSIFWGWKPQPLFQLTKTIQKEGKTHLKGTSCNPAKSAHKDQRSLVLGNMPISSSALFLIMFIHLDILLDSRRSMCLLYPQRCMENWPTGIPVMSAGTFPARISRQTMANPDTRIIKEMNMTKICGSGSNPGNPWPLGPT